MANDYTFAVRSDLAIVGTHPEMADFCNPRGELEGLVHYIVASLPDGRRFAHDASAYTINGWVIDGGACEVEDEDSPSFRVDSNGITVERLERLASHLNSIHPELLVLSDDHWTEIQAAYGSDAYVRDGWEDVAVDLEREDARWERYGA